MSGENKQSSEPVIDSEHNMHDLVNNMSVQDAARNCSEEEFDELYDVMLGKVSIDMLKHMEFGKGGVKIPITEDMVTRARLRVASFLKILQSNSATEVIEDEVRME